MGIEKINQATNTTEGDRAKLVALEQQEGHNEYTKIFDDIERDPFKAQAIIAQALQEKAVAEKAFQAAMSATDQSQDNDVVTKSAKEISDALLEKMRGKVSEQ